MLKKKKVLGVLSCFEEKEERDESTKTDDRYGINYLNFPKRSSCVSYVFKEPPEPT